jgi:hypothetical protein
MLLILQNDLGRLAGRIKDVVSSIAVTLQIRRSPAIHREQPSPGAGTVRLAASVTLLVLLGLHPGPSFFSR